MCIYIYIYIYIGYIYMCIYGLIYGLYIANRGGKSMKIFYSSKSTIALIQFYLSTNKCNRLIIYSSKSKK